MSYEQSRSAYQTAAASGATHGVLVQLVYTHLAQDLLRAADAMRQRSVEGRCAASKHALLLLGHLESWVDELSEPDLAMSLRSFYGMLRTSVLAQQKQLDPSVLEQCANMVLETRAAWQQKEAQLAIAGVGAGPMLPPSAGPFSFHA